MRQKPTVSERVWSMVFFLLSAVLLTWMIGNYILNGRGDVEIEREKNDRIQREQMEQRDRSADQF